MTRRQRISFGFAALAITAGAVGLGVNSRSHALELITNPAGNRHLPTETPADHQLPYEDVVVTTADGLKLVGWYIPSAGRAAVVLVHGYKDHRGLMLGVAELLHGYGYGVLVSSLRAHDRSDGELISFGIHEMKDLDAWFGYARSRSDVDAGRIGMMGVSMGGFLAIQHTARNPGIRALVADCAFSSLSDTVATSVKFFTGLPAFPFAPMIVFWTEREIGMNSSDLDAKKWIGKISPRPVFVLQGGADVVISPVSGELLFRAAGEPKEFWYEPTLGHAEFLAKRPEEFARRIREFFGRYLSASGSF